MERTKLNVVCKHIGEACKKWRKENTTLTAEDIAKHIGMTQTAVSAFENGHTNNLYIFMAYVNAGFDPLESEGVWKALNSY